MTVSRKDFGQSQDQLFTGWRLGHETRITTPNVIPVDAMPVQYLNPVGAMTVKLPLAAPNGRMFILTNISAQIITVTDSADAAIAGGTIIAAQSGVFQKRDAVWMKLGELVLVA